MLFPGTRLAVTTAAVPNGNANFAILCAPKNEERATSRYKVLVKGPTALGPKGEPGDRREALVGLLEELEKRVYKEMLAPGV